MCGLIANVLIRDQCKVKRPTDMTYDFFTVERDRACYLALSVFVGNALCQSFLFSRSVSISSPEASDCTFVKTAIEAKALPKFIPTTAGSEEISMGASALPFGTDFGAIGMIFST